jgi:NADH:ubiquinone oxidoreductase subunit F (NADH-binding)/ferredoxin
VVAPAVPVVRIGQPRVTAGLHLSERLDLEAHRAEFGSLPAVPFADLVYMAEEVDLRGRGGAAFPVARKLRATAAAAKRRRRRAIVVVNAAEGEPGSAKDKMLLARSPHLVLDGALLAARALNAREIVIAAAGDGPHVASVSTAVAADPALRRLARVVSVPDRLVSGESGALVNAINGKSALPPGHQVRTSAAGVDGTPTLLSNAETFAQLAVLAMLGPAGYGSVGGDDEPGTVLLTVGGSVSRPAVVEVPSQTPLGHVLDICGAEPAHGVLVGGYHGVWLPPEAAYGVAISRAGLAAAGGTLGAGVVLVLGADSCPLGEVARVAGYLAMQSSGQCGPCKLGLPAVARSLAAISEGAGSVEELERARQAAGGVRGRGACAHPDGTSNFVISALEVFAADLTEHLFRGQCGLPVQGVLPVPAGDGESTGTRLTVDWTRCKGHGLCSRLVPELVQLDEHGYPEVLAATVPFWLARDARQAVQMCPAMALTLAPEPPAPPPHRPPAAAWHSATIALPPSAPALPPSAPALPPSAPALPPSAPALPRPRPRPTLVAKQAPASKRARGGADFEVTTEWIATLAGGDGAGLGGGDYR